VRQSPPQVAINLTRFRAALDDHFVELQSFHRSVLTLA
jgi:hypothetical protein